MLPNAWDAVTARAVTEAGFPAVATTSAGVAASLGYEDGEHCPPAEMLAAVGRIARYVDVPVTADLEAGYGLTADALVAGLLEAGAVGLNLEDTNHATGALQTTGEQAQWLAGVRAAASAAGVDVVLNARIDVVLRGTDEASVEVEAILTRARAYLEAGASCVYPITLTDETAIATLVRELDAPVNILLLPGGPRISRLSSLGVARISLGNGLQDSVTRFLRTELAELH